MAYEITSVADQIKPASNLSLADMVNIGRGVQAYKSGEIALEQQDVGNQEQRRIAEAVKQDPNLFMTDSRLDMDKVNKIIPQLAPRTGQKYLQDYSTLHTAQTQALEAKRNFGQNIKSNIGSHFRILGEAGVNDPKAVFALADQLKEQYKDQPDVQRYLDAAMTPFKMTEAGPQVSQMLIRGAQTLLTPTEQETVFGPKTGTMNLGTDIVQYNQKARPGGLPQQLTVNTQQPLAEAQLAPGARLVPTGQRDMNNNPTALAYGKDGSLLGEVTIPAGANPAQMPGGMANQQPGAMQPLPAPQNVQPAPAAQMPRPAVTAQPVIPAAATPANAPVRMPAGENASTLEAATNLRLKTRELAQNVGVQQFNSDQIIKLADEVISGKGAGTLANLTGGYAGLNGLGIGGKNATNLQQLGHYMALQTQALTAGTGLGNTDAGRAIGGQIAGDIQWTPEAIKQTARVNRALSTGTELFAQGVDNAFTRSKGNPFAATEFQQRWSTALGNDGINAIRLYDAIRKKDNEAIKEVVTQAGGADSAGYQNLVNKIGQMQKLIGGK
jgi:hypothetical protein